MKEDNEIGLPVTPLEDGEGKRVMVIGHEQHSTEILHRVIEGGDGGGVILVTSDDVIKNFSKSVDLRAIAHEQLRNVDMEMFKLMQGLDVEESVNLRALKRKGLSPEVLKEILYSSSERMEGEAHEDYKKRRNLKKLIEKYRCELNLSK